MIIYKGGMIEGFEFRSYKHVLDFLNLCFGEFRVFK